MPARRAEAMQHGSHLRLGHGAAAQRAEERRIRGQIEQVPPPDPGLNDLTGSRVDADGATPVPLAVQHGHRADLAVDVLEVQRQRFAATQTGAVQRHDQGSVADAVARGL
jgi:hypothetical protein